LVALPLLFQEPWNIKHLKVGVKQAAQAKYQGLNTAINPPLKSNEHMQGSGIYELFPGPCLFFYLSMNYLEIF
jgi:hypothetical protein